MARFAEKQVAEMLRGARKFRVYDFPGIADLQIAVRCLSEAEMDGVELNALEQLERHGKRQKWDINVMADAAAQLHQSLIQRQIVWYATYDASTIAADRPVQFFAKHADLLDLDTGTVTKLFSLYCEHQSWINPLHSLDEAGVKELAEALGKAQGHPEVSLELLSGRDRSTLVQLLIALASRQFSTSP